MSLCVLGMAEEFRSDGVAVNALWPRTTIATAALAMLPGMMERIAQTRKPEIVAEAALVIFGRDARTTTGNFFIDEDVLRTAGVSDFEPYAMETGHPLIPDLFVA